MFKEYKTVYRNSKFVHLWVSQIFSQVTINLLNYLLLIRIFSITNSSLATSFLWVSYALPAIFAGPIGAASVDFVSKRKVLMFSNLAQAIVILTLALFHPGRFYLIFAIVFMYAFFNQFYVPAEQATLPTVVPKKYLAFANGLFFITQQVALILGFGVAGILNKYLGFEKSLFLASGMLFIAFISVSFLPELKPIQKIKGAWEEALIMFFKKIYEGYQFIKSKKSILFPFLLLICMQIVVSVVIVNVPVLAQDVLGISLNLAGVAIVVPVGVGAVLGALTIPKLLKKNLRKRKSIENSLFAMSLFVFLLVFVVPQFSFILRTILAFLATIVVGISFVGIMIPAQTYLQEVTPGGMRGRVFGNFWFLTTIATIFPVIFSGTVVEIFGVRILFALLLAAIFSGFIISRRYQHV